LEQNNLLISYISTSDVPTLCLAGRAVYVRCDRLYNRSFCNNAYKLFGCNINVVIGRVIAYVRLHPPRLLMLRCARLQWTVRYWGA